ncbi:shikimate dehydrogenase family protein [Brevundimonas sp.]|uniref:shikimate dehydrogenase family protein n=1 Tax=Brevundimonas sp. TaxID=1871086 RepID=UPI002C46AF83|nr:NAD(P)-binding domain-containing protein [Brevundimonas sp.]HWQ87691.1 NAD(P)-binding domain-containing protein [Brevundimonas sp.]
MTVVAGVAGQPIAQSLSPVIHGTWIAAAGLDAVYRAFGPADAAAFADLVGQGRRGVLRGLNVTAPFKEQALALADEVAAAARACGSANLLVFEDGRIRADSTDGEGLMGALAEQAPELEVNSRPVVILGAGGAARAAAAALMAAGAQVGVLNRTAERARALADDLGVAVVEAGALGEAALVVNALSVPPSIDPAALKSEAVLMDMTYRPLVTPFLAAGRARGLTTVDGLAMLIGQAKPSFRALFGVEPPDVDVRRAALAALGEAE